jgi:oligopeptide/dipeptide ABC transporter ATP-binding protein
MSSLLEVNNLKAYFFTHDSVIRAVDGVTFVVKPREIVGLAGESGCGKSVTTQCILRLLPNPGKIVEGEIRFQGEDLLLKSPEEMRQIRGRKISIMVQDALAALNPVITTGEQVVDIYRAHNKIPKTSAWQRAVEMFRQVGIPNARVMVKRFAHEFSGGMQQRTVIASALVCSPDLIIADEPTTALDVTIQLQILALLREARDELGSGILYISHDLAAVAQICDRVLIMYAGEIVEHAQTNEIFNDPKHPYTQGLLASIPPLGGDVSRYLSAIPGMPPDPSALATGCRFADRCDKVMDVCRRARPDLIPIGPSREVRCYLYSPEDSIH